MQGSSDGQVLPPNPDNNGVVPQPDPNMQQQPVNNEQPVPQAEQPVGPTIIQTDQGAQDGQNRCPSCGATDIALIQNSGLLRCNFCRHEFKAEKAFGIGDDVFELQGQVLGSGATNIVADTKDILTFKCSSCGAEVVIDTGEAAQGRCHWCRNILSVNQQIPNGSIPDMVLPFGINKQTAQEAIQAFVKKRQFFAFPKFKEEFCTGNIMGVYLPYMVIDVNAHVRLKGQGERLVRSYSRGSGKQRRTYYDADLYNIEREFDIGIDDLTIESSSDKLNTSSADVTNNVINAIMPFDTENCVKWDANFIKGFTSEKRDSNVEDLREHKTKQCKDVARHKANESLNEYNRGVRWDQEDLNVRGEKWKAAYLPVWLYSYQQVKGNKKLLHYVAVNARSQKVMGSIPIHQPKLLLFSFIAAVLGLFGIYLIPADISFLFLLSGPVFYFAFYSKYRNKSARHTHENDTKATLVNMRQTDVLMKRLTGLSNARMSGANNLEVSNKSAGSKFMDKLGADPAIKSVMGVTKKK
jgi:DNA-directed RNA polymerase subunit RPC12/RpoP